MAGSAAAAALTKPSGPRSEKREFKDREATKAASVGLACEKAPGRQPTRDADVSSAARTAADSETPRLGRDWSKGSVGGGGVKSTRACNRLFRACVVCMGWD